MIGRVIAIDYGMKRCGVAITDSLRLSANGYPTVETQLLMKWLQDYFKLEQVAILIIGHPRHKDGNDTYLVKDIDAFVLKLKTQFPNLIVLKVNEWGTSLQARKIIINSGVSKTKRQDKGLTDKVSAVIMLTEFLDSTDFRNLQPDSV